jgi:hypothetical protein
MSDVPSNNHVPDSDFGPDDEHANGRHAFVKLGDFLREHDWNPQQIPDKYIYRMPFRGQNGLMYVYAQVRIEAEQFLCYVLAPIKAPEEVRPAVAEYLTRANYGLYIGNFEFDYSDGEIRYKSSLDFENATLTADLIRNTLYPALQMMDRYLPGLMKVAYGGAVPEQAIAEIED